MTQQEKEALVRAYEPYAYVLDSIEGCDDDVNTDKMSDTERIKFALDRFCDEYNTPWAHKQWPILSERIGQWLRGLPSAVRIAFSDYNIEKISESWGIKRTDHSIMVLTSNNWFEFIGECIVDIYRKLVDDSHSVYYI